jgi:hypothetical protein
MISRASLHVVLAEGHVTERSLPHRYGKAEMAAQKDAVVFFGAARHGFPDVRPTFVSYMFVGIDNLLSWPDHEVSLRSHLGW